MEDQGHVNNDALETATSENELHEDFSDSLSDNSLAIWPTSPDVTENEESPNSMVHNAIAKAKTS